MLFIGGGRTWAANPEGTTDLKDLTGNYAANEWGQWTYPWTFTGSNYAGDGNGDAESKHVDVTNYNTIVVQISAVGKTSQLRAFFWDEVNMTVKTLFFHPTTESNPNFANGYDISEAGTYYINMGKYHNLKGLKLPWSGDNPDTRSFTIEAAYLTPKPYPTNCTDLRDLEPSNGYGNNAWPGYFVYPKTINGSNLIGNGEGSNESEHVNISKYESITFEVTSADNCALRLWMWDPKTSKVVTLYPRPAADYETTTNWETSYTITTAGTYKVNLCGYKYLKGMKPLGGNGSVTVSTMYATPKGYTPITSKVTTGDATSSLAAISGHSWGAGTFPMNSLGENTTVCGNGSNDGDNISNISEYNWILFAVSQASGKNFYRTWVAKDIPASGKATGVETLYPHPVAEAESVADWTASNAVTSAGLYVINVSEYSVFNGIKTLQSWAGNLGTSNLAAVRMLKSLDEVKNMKFSLTGNIYEENTGDLATWANMCENITYDATDVEEGVELLDPWTLKTTKDNGIYTVTLPAGKTNTNTNIMVGTTIANLVLTDGYSFAVPTGAKATSATYTRSKGSKNAYGTICLPYDFSATGATIYSATLNGDAIILTAEDSPKAGKPYIYTKTVDDNMTFSASSESTLAAATTNGTLTGTYTKIKAPVGSYVLQTQDGEQKFYVVETSQPNIPAFRAYIAASASGAHLRIVPNTEEVTLINSVLSDLNSENPQIYDINGRKLQNLQKGLNIVNGVKVYVK